MRILLARLALLPAPAAAQPARATLFRNVRVFDGARARRAHRVRRRAHGGSTPTISKEATRAVIAAAHRRGRLAVVHVGDLAGGRDAIDAGADGLAHLFADRDPAPRSGGS